MTDLEKACQEFIDIIAKAFKIDKLAKWLNDKLEGVK